MESTQPLSMLFASGRPPALELPHLITALDAELIGKVAHLTKSKIGLWSTPAPFDEQDVYDRARESAPLAAWALPANQAEVLSFGPYLQETVFGTKLLFLDAAFDELVLTEMAVLNGERLATGAYVTHGFENLPELPQLVERCQWVLIPIGPDRSKALLAVSKARADWIAKMQEWCEREGRNFAELRSDNGAVVLVDRPASEKYRTNAINHCIDAFLGNIETFFGGADESILPAIQERIGARNQLRLEARKAGQASPPAC